jgi:hypothetical protein
MIYQKGNMWKIMGKPDKYFTEQEAKAAAGIREAVIKEAMQRVPDITATKTLSPLEILRRAKALCTKCECDPCECDEEWKSADET